MSKKISVRERALETVRQALTKLVYKNSFSIVNEPLFRTISDSGWESGFASAYEDAGLEALAGKGGAQ